jgi:hypothetical protein
LLRRCLGFQLHKPLIGTAWMRSSNGIVSEPI